MELIHDHTEIKTVRKINILNGPVMELAYTQTGRKFRAETITIPYVLTRSGWVAEQSFIKISGTVLKKDGSDGATRHTWWEHRENHPMWVMEIVYGYMPSGEVSLPAVAEARDLNAHRSV